MMRKTSKILDIQPFPSFFLGMLVPNDYSKSQPVPKKVKVLSDEYLYKIASICGRNKSLQRYTLNKVSVEPNENILMMLKGDVCLREVSRNSEDIPSSSENDVKFHWRKNNENLAFMENLSQSKKMGVNIHWCNRHANCFRDNSFTLYNGLEKTNTAKSPMCEFRDSDSCWYLDGQHLGFHISRCGSSCANMNRKSFSGSRNLSSQKFRFCKQNALKVERISERFKGRKRFMSEVSQNCRKKNHIKATGMDDCAVMDKSTYVMSLNISKPESFPAMKFQSCIGVNSKRGNDISGVYSLEELSDQNSTDDYLASCPHSSDSDSSYEGKCVQTEHFTQQSFIKCENADRKSDMYDEDNFLETSDTYSEGSYVISGDEDDSQRCLEVQDEDVINMHEIEDRRNFSYMVDVLTEAGILSCYANVESDSDILESSFFETLEKKYGNHCEWKMLERKLLFDRINTMLKETLQAHMGIPAWTRSVRERVKIDSGKEAIDDEIWRMLATQEVELARDSDKVFGKDDGWMRLGNEIQFIGKEIENFLMNELVDDELFVI